MNSHRGCFGTEFHVLEELTDCLCDIQFIQSSNQASDDVLVRVVNWPAAISCPNCRVHLKWTAVITHYARSAPRALTPNEAEIVITPII